MKASLFAGFNNAVRAMQTSQFATSLHGSNIAHSNDTTYTRRVLAPETGLGSRGPTVQRLRDAFVDNQYRTANGSLGESEVRHNIMRKIEDVLGDPVEGGLRQVVDQLFDSWQGLAENPSDAVSRLQVLSSARAFVQQVKSTHQQLAALETTINEEMAARVNEVNHGLTRIFELNKRISEVMRSDHDASALLDERDVTLDRLAKLTGAVPHFQEDGTVRLIVGPTPVIDGPTVARLGLVDTADGTVPTWSAYNNPTYAGKGTVGGLLRIRTGEVSRLKADIANLGRTIAEAVNALHRSGTGIGGDTGIDFFLVGSGPADLVVNPDLQPHQIAAGSSSGLPGEGGNARRIAALGEAELLESVIVPGQFQPPRSYFRNLIGWIGSVAQNAKHEESIAEVQTRTAEQHRMADWGVSLDEEVAQMTLQQKAFAAAARVISVMDEMLDTLINRTA